MKHAMWEMRAEHARGVPSMTNMCVEWVDSFAFYNEI